MSRDKRKKKRKKDRKMHEAHKSIKANSETESTKERCKGETKKARKADRIHVLTCRGHADRAVGIGEGKVRAAEVERWRGRLSSHVCSRNQQHKHTVDCHGVQSSGTVEKNGVGVWNRDSRQVRRVLFFFFFRERERESKWGKRER